MSITHASIIPLIGGITLGSEIAFKTRPKYLLSWDAFKDNDQHLVNWYEDVPYYKLDTSVYIPNKKVDVVSALCPCAGLSTIAVSRNTAHNDWLIKAADYVLTNIKPYVYWGENAPTLMGVRGDAIRQNMLRIAKNNGYTVSFYKTASVLHGLSQKRQRSFYFFYKYDKVPIFDWFRKKPETIDKTILAVNATDDPINSRIPTENPYYIYLLDRIFGGASHKTYVTKLHDIKGPQGVRDIIRRHGVDHLQLGNWMWDNGYENQAEICYRKFDKLQTGAGIWDKGMVIPRGVIGAFVTNMKTDLIHPTLDRYITYKEALAIMGMPTDMQIMGNMKQNANHICQNVPVTTAADFAGQVKKFLYGKLAEENETVIYQNNLNQTTWYLN